MRRLLAVLPFALAATSALADCKDEVIDIMDRSTLAGPFRTEAAIMAGPRKIIVESVVVPPNDMRTRTTVDGKTQEIVKIGDRVWVDQGTGFREAPAGVAQQLSRVSEQQRRVEPSLVNAVDCKGTQTVDGREMIVYAYKIDLPGGKGSSSNTLYVDPASRLPARVVVEGRAGSAISRTEMKYIFDAALRLEPPAVVAPAPAEGGGEAPAGDAAPQP
jgi:hypothetical protein